MDNEAFLQAMLAAEDKEAFAARVWEENPSRLVLLTAPYRYIFEHDGVAVPVWIYTDAEKRTWAVLPPTAAATSWTILYHVDADGAPKPPALTVNVNVQGFAEPDWKAHGKAISEALGTYMRGQR